MPATQTKAVDVAPAQRGKVWCLATSASSVAYTLDDDMIDNYVTLECQGEAIQYQLGDSTVSVTEDAVSTGTPPAVTINNASGARLPADQSVSFKVPKGVTTIAVVATGTSGFWRLYRSNNLK